MYRAFFAGSELLHLPIFTMFLFLTLFLGVIGFVLVRRPARFDEAARLPLADDAPTGGDRHG